MLLLYFSCCIITKYKILGDVMVFFFRSIYMMKPADLKEKENRKGRIFSQDLATLSLVSGFFLCQSTCPVFLLAYLRW